MVIGIILLLAGAGSAIYGVTQNNSGIAQFESFLSSGSINPGSAWIIGGAVVAVIGLIILIVSATKKKS